MAAAACADVWKVKNTFVDVSDGEEEEARRPRRPYCTMPDVGSLLQTADDEEDSTPGGGNSTGYCEWQEEHPAAAAGTCPVLLGARLPDSKVSVKNTFIDAAADEDDASPVPDRRRFQTCPCPQVLLEEEDESSSAASPLPAGQRGAGGGSAGEAAARSTGRHAAAAPAFYVFAEEGRVKKAEDGDSSPVLRRMMRNFDTLDLREQLFEEMECPSPRAARTCRYGTEDLREHFLHASGSPAAGTGMFAQPARGSLVPSIAEDPVCPQQAGAGTNMANGNHADGVSPVPLSLFDTAMPAAWPHAGAGGHPSAQAAPATRLPLSPAQTVGPPPSFSNSPGAQQPAMPFSLSQALGEAAGSRQPPTTFAPPSPGSPCPAAVSSDSRSTSNPGSPMCKLPPAWQPEMQWQLVHGWHNAAMPCVMPMSFPWCSMPPQEFAHQRPEPTSPHPRPAAHDSPSAARAARAAHSGPSEAAAANSPSSAGTGRSRRRAAPAPATSPGQAGAGRPLPEAEAAGQPAAAAQGSAGAGGVRGTRRTRLWAHIHLHMQSPGFDLVPRLIGRKGCNMRKIAESTGAKIRIRGRGSGHLEIDGKYEAPTPLMVAVTTDKADEDGFRGAVVAMLEELRNVEKRFHTFVQQKNLKHDGVCYSIGNLPDKAKDCLGSILDDIPFSEEKKPAVAK
eukprot:CAMPEP_0168403338 /NCGR_PEP_ID=MMETSP0228-20121227/24077_1 /TAXON_ID=133427 /ORGANISM="Protoceratium reticulatum, Strain CCCM 535 (=CCMP 1889)" /LENGTH=674 /DNA_ID=CAMNT_0008416937 /DNA_START=43 /DNA_END=2067 /DNA_ORIENTATION=+